MVVHSTTWPSQIWHKMWPMFEEFRTFRQGGGGGSTFGVVKSAHPGVLGYFERLGIGPST